MKTIYLNLEDDVAKVVAKIKAQKTEELVLVIPKEAYILADSINLRLLKKQVDILGNKVSILTMDTTGQMYAKEAGFPLRQLPKISRSHGFSDIRPMVQSKSISTRDVIATSSKPKKVAEATTSQTTKKTRSAVLSPEVASAKVFTHRSPAKTVLKSPHPIKETSWLTPDPKDLRSKPDNVFIPPNNKTNKPPQRRSYRKLLVAFVAIVLIVVTALVVVVLPGANVVVYARSQTVARDLELVIDANQTSVDANKLVIPATKVDQTKQVSNSFTVNGKKEVGSKAQGRVAIYNLTGSPMNLKSSTTVLTVGSKNYYFAQDVNGIVALESPSKDSKATTADIIASDGGEGFNLPAGTRVEINNQTFGSQPQRLYAKTVTQVIGGSSRFLSVLSKEDSDSAQKELIKSAVAEVNNSLSDGRRLVDGAYNVEVTNFTTDKPIDTETTSFTASATIKISGLAFNETDLKTMVRGRLNQTLGSDKTLQELEKDTIVYKIKNLDLSTGIMQLTIHYESQAKPTIDKVDMANQLTGKSKEQASDILLTNPNIERVEITLVPSWQKSFPRLSSKTHIEVVE